MFKILIVDDSSTMRQLLMACLASVNADCAEASTGLEAIERLTTEGFDLVFLDINMPDMNGVDVIDFVKAHERLSQLPVVVVTTRADSALRERMMASGVKRYLTKPFTADQVLDAARTFLPRGDDPL